MLPGILPIPRAQSPTNLRRGDVGQERGPRPGEEIRSSHGKDRLPIIPPQVLRSLDIFPGCKPQDPGGISTLQLLKSSQGQAFPAELPFDVRNFNLQMARKGKFCHLVTMVEAKQVLARLLVANRDKDAIDCRIRRAVEGKLKVSNVERVERPAVDGNTHDSTS